MNTPQQCNVNRPVSGRRPTFPSESCTGLCSKSCRMRSAVGPQDIVSTCTRNHLHNSKTAGSHENIFPAQEKDNMPARSKSTSSQRTHIRFLRLIMLLMVRTPGPLGRLLVPRHGLGIPPPPRHARVMVLGAAATGVGLLDVLHAVGSEGVREYFL